MLSLTKKGHVDPHVQLLVIQGQMGQCVFISFSRNLKLFHRTEFIHLLSKQGNHYNWNNKPFIQRSGRSCEKNGIRLYRMLLSSN